MKLSLERKFILPVTIVIVVYTVLFIYSLNFCYFWDAIQQISSEANWYYQTNFASVIIHPVAGLDTLPTGYHPPLLSMITAGLWKILGRELWVSHAFTFIWVIILLYHSWKLVTMLIPSRWAGWAYLLIVFEPTTLSQMVMASPDFILLTGLVVSLHAILRQKPIWLALALIMVCGVNMRGVMASLLLFFAHLYYDVCIIHKKKYSWKDFGKILLPYLPALALLSAYFGYYLSSKGWFFTHDKRYADHYTMPENTAMIIKNLLSYILRLIEYGRVLVWGVAVYWLVMWIRKRVELDGKERFLGVYLLLFGGLFLLFCFITQLPVSCRYFMPLFFIVYLLVFSVSARYWSETKMKCLVIAMLFFSITGHAWIYPEKMAQSWESTLLHTPYYSLRKQCFDYIDSNQINYSEVGAGFCLSGYRDRIELIQEEKPRITGWQDDNKFFIYSNISNMGDNEIDELKSEKWTAIKHFEQWPVFITIYKKNPDISQQE